MDKRLDEINSLLSEYSLGKFDKEIKLSKELDKIDAIISGINMLGQELKSTTVSRDFFTNIFDSVSDMVFILDYNGIIQNINSSAESQLRYPEDSLTGKPISILYRNKRFNLKNTTHQLFTAGKTISKEDYLITSDGVALPVTIHISAFHDQTDQRLILLTAADISFRIKTENVIIRAIIDTQEKERRRLAKDLHDSLSQQLSAIKFYISSTAELVANPEQKANLMKSNEALTEVMADMRNICFNLMPKTLEEFGLVKAVKEFCNQFLYKKAQLLLKENNTLPELPYALKIDLYRVIQEFISNAINHGRADIINITFDYRKQILKTVLTDNGKGFDISLSAMGMGLKNVSSRIKSHNGSLVLKSVVGKGTTYKITIPLNF